MITPNSLNYTFLSYNYLSTKNVIFLTIFRHYRTVYLLSCTWNSNLKKRILMENKSIFKPMLLLVYPCIGSLENKLTVPLLFQTYKQLFY